MSEKRVVQFKVFLCDFNDVRAPSGFSRDFFRELVFGATRPERLPAPDSSPFGATIFQFFFSCSDGRLRISGDVTDWAHSSLDSGNIPHWNRRMTDPTTTTSLVNYGESWPVIVAETLRGLGFISANYDSAQALRRAVLSLPNGLRADRLVFLNADRGTGGAKRSFGQMRAQLNKMSASNNNVRFVPGTTNLWNTLWDEAWSGLPDLLQTPIAQAQGTSREANGTITGPPSPPESLRMPPLSILFHEFGHLAADFPDLYGAQYAPWGVFDLMGGPAAGTHFPMPFGSYLRRKAGWLNYIDRSREDHRFRLRPLESHNDAIRLTNGAPGSNHFLVLENRSEMHYGAADSPPTNHGQMLLAYRLDEHGRLRIPRNGTTVKKITGVVRRQEYYGEAWRVGMTIGSVPPPNEIHSNPVTCRNALGELWWTIDEITDAGAGDLRVEAKLNALQLLGDYHRARWEGRAPGQAPLPLTLDFFSGSAGHVMLQDDTMPVQDRSRGRALYLHPSWAANARIRGVYDLSSLARGPFRMWAKLAMPDEAVGSDGTSVTFRSGEQSFSISLQPGDYEEVCFDFLNPSTNLTITGRAGMTATRDWIYILDGWLVPLAPVVFDFLKDANSASWTSGTGPLTFGVQGQPTGEVSLRRRMRLHTGVRHGPQVLFTHPNWSMDGFIQGAYSNVNIPSDGAFLRAAIGWHFGRVVTGNGAGVTIKVTYGETTVPLIENADINLYPSTSTDPMERNDLTILELPLPRETWGENVAFQIRVDTAGSAAQDWVSWPYLALTTA